MQSQLFKLADEQIPQPDIGSVYMDTGSSAPLSAPSQDQAPASNGGMDMSLREHVFSVLEDLGVQPRHLTDPKISRKIFQQRSSIGSGQLSGSFMIPSATKKSRITESRASEIGRQICAMFGLDGEMSHEGRNYVVNFRSKKPEAIKPSTENDSFADLAGDAPTKAASAHHDAFVMRKSAIADALKKAGFRI
jgi:hypothetical protein